MKVRLLQAAPLAAENQLLDLSECRLEDKHDVLLLDGRIEGFRHVPGIARGRKRPVQGGLLNDLAAEPKGGISNDKIWQNGAEPAAVL